MVECILYWGGGVNKQAPEMLTCRGFWGNSLPENFEILKFGNATFSILNKDLMWINGKMTDVLLLICYLIHI